MEYFNVNSDNWKMNKAGFVNFWYYDNQVYNFADGKLLLRGSNGSGKSVTMQSLLPLLLDGNTSPERLDPFGTRSRKIENYMIDDGFNAFDERTGYVYMEFSRLKANSFLTIGIGIRARKNKRPDKWYFIIADGRRVGQDISLVKNSGGDIPLTKKELENRIGAGGFVFDSRIEYMDKVNKHLFGFENIDDYSDLLGLLIQLRSPKLSKDYKPTKLYDIMTESLQPLSENELKPMSDAIESMDAVKTKLDNLKVAQKSCNKIKDVYDKYNRMLLGIAADRLVQDNKKIGDINNELNNIQTLISKATAEINENEKMKVAVETNIKKYTDEEELLKQGNAYKLENERLEFIKKLVECKEKINIKSKELEKKKDKQKICENQVKEFTDKSERLKKDLDKISKEILSSTRELAFNEFEPVYEELKKDYTRSIDLNGVVTRFSKYTDKIKAALKLLTEKNREIEIYKGLEKDLSDKKQEVDKSEHSLQTAQNQFLTAKDEYISAISSYNVNNSIINISKTVLSQLNERVFNYDVNSNYDEVIYSIFLDFYMALRTDINIKIKEKDSEIEGKNKEITQVKEKLEHWENLLEPEPFRTEEVLRNREKLKSLNIPYVELYKTIDFTEDTSDEMKGIIEEALVEMGLLDALIIPEKYKETVLNLEGNYADKYIFAEPKYFGKKFIDNLYVEKQALKKYVNNNSYCEELILNVENIIKSIVQDDEDDCSCSISNKGIYKNGILTGKTTNEYVAKYIGVEARERLRQSMIDQINGELNVLKDELNILNDEFEALNNKLKICEEEKNNFPSKSLVEEPKELLRNSEFKHKYATDNYERVLGEVKKVENKLKDLNEKIFLACDTVKIEPKSFEKYDEAFYLAKEVEKDLNTLCSNHVRFIENNSILEGKLSDNDFLLSDIDDIQAEIRGFKLEKQGLDERIKNLEETLKTTDYEEIKSRIDLCVKMKAQLPAERDKAINEIARNKEKISYNRMELDKQFNQLNVAKDNYKASKEVFLNEYNLKLIDECILSEDFVHNEDLIVKAAKDVLKLLNYDRNLALKKDNLSQKLAEIYHTEKNSLSEYIISLEIKNNRSLIIAKLSGKVISFLDLIKDIEYNISLQNELIKERDREIFEEILINNLNKTIRNKIVQAKKWVAKVNDLMDALDTSSGLSLSIKWKGKAGESEDELTTEDLVSILDKDSKYLKEEDKDKFTKHFRAKIERAKRISEDQNETKNFYNIIKELFDYRQWFEFQLFYTKTNERKKELTDNSFYQFSGGEKALSMYIPLFSAVCARYIAASANCPRLIALDEAFAGVDSKNIRDMFKLLGDMNLDYILNSQVLWGEYDTVSSLGISEINRPNNANVITVIEYVWNGKNREISV